MAVLDTNSFSYNTISRTCFYLLPTMAYAELYSRSNGLQIQVAKYMLAEFEYQIDWQPAEGKAKILDIGSRDGDVLVNVLLPAIPSKYVDSVIAVDSSKDMVQEARRKHGNHKTVTFVPFDIGDTKNDIIAMFGPYTHVTSFFWLDRIEDNGVSMKNIFKLMKPGGHFFAVFIRQHALVPVYPVLAETSKYGVVLQDWITRIPPFCLQDAWRKHLNADLSSAGFTNIHAESRTYTSHLPTEQAMKESLQTVDFFRRKVPPRFREDYMEEVMLIFKKQLVPQRREALDHTVDAVAVYAKKPPK